MEMRKTKSGGYGMLTGLVWIVILGIILSVGLGWLLKIGPGGDLSSLAALLTTGIALAYILLAVGDWLVQLRAVAANPLPDSLDVSDRMVAREQSQALKGSSLLHRHLRRLLGAWAAGASGPQVAAMAAQQSQRRQALVAGETAMVLALLAFSSGFNAPQVLLTLGTGLMMVLLLVGLARFQLAAQIAGYIDSHLLARIGNDTPAAASLDFANAVAKSVADSTAALAAAQTKFTDQLAKAIQDSTAQLSKAQAEAAAQIAKAQQEASALVAKSQGETALKLTTAQQDSIAQLARAQDKVAEQLARVTEIAASVDTIFRLQQAVDQTLQGVTATEEFKSTLAELKRHLAESDQLLRQVAKPRTIRLIEKEAE